MAVNISGIKWIEKGDIEMSKVEFVRELCKFYKETVGNIIEIDDMDYKVIDGKEFCYVQFKSGGIKRFCIDGDNNQGILLDFSRFLKFQNDYQWIF